MWRKRTTVPRRQYAAPSRRDCWRSCALALLATWCGLRQRPMQIIAKLHASRAEAPLMTVTVISANGMRDKPDWVTQAPADTCVRSCIFCLSTKGKAQNVTLINRGYAIRGMPCVTRSGIAPQSPFMWFLADQFTVFKRPQTPHLIACAGGNACPLMSSKVNDLDFLREDTNHGSGSFYRVGYSRSAPPDTACPPASTTD